MKRIMNQENSIWAGIFLMGAGTVLAQMINVLAQPILTRIVSAEILGIYTYIVSLATVIIPISSLKLDMLIVSEKEDNIAQYITDTCIYINIAITLIYTVIIFVGYNISDKNIFNKYGKIIYFVPVLVLTNGIRFLFISYNNRYKRYKLISSVAIMREGIRTIIQLLSGFFKGGIVGLVMGYALSPLFGLKIQMKDYLEKRKDRRHIRASEIYNIITKTGKRQILYLVPAQFINSFSSSLITISIMSLFSAQSLGYYSAGVRVLEIPMVFISSNVSKVCYQKISENISLNKPIKKILLSVICGVACVSALGFAILYCIAPTFSEIVFGKGYNIAGEYIKCLCIMYAARLVTTSFNGLFTLFNKQQIDLVCNIFLVLVAGISHILTKLLNLNILSYLKIIAMGYGLIYLIMLLGYIWYAIRYDIENEKVKKNGA